MEGIVIGICLGFAIGLVVSRFKYTSKPIGNLRIDNSDPDDGPYLFLELSSDSTPSVLKLKKYVTLKVRVEDYISHE